MKKLLEMLDAMLHSNDSHTMEAINFICDSKVNGSFGV